MKAVITLRDALAIRTAVLDGGGEVERDSGVMDGVEFACWRVTGKGWRARVTNKWDLQRAMTARSAPDAPSVEDATGYERLELSVDHFDPDMPVLEIEYRIEGGDEKLVRFEGGRWERLFEVGTFKPVAAGLRKSLWLQALSTA